MQQRLSHAEVAPELMHALSGVNIALSKSSLGRALIDLIFLRASQLNGCAFCVDMHGHDLLKAGASMRRLNAVTVWREAPYFDERERAVLAWVEALTQLGNGPVPDSVYEPLKAYFSDKEIVALTYAVAVINAWNRIGVGFSLQPDDADSRLWPQER